MIGTELTPRKQAVLKAIVKAYIETGEPVGSKILTELLENAPSSATLRNEMSELCQLGLLHQPHTSAGRVPTVGGFKMYVDTLMPQSDASGDTIAFIDNALKDINCEPEGIPAIAAKAISALTGLPAIACLITDNSPKIKRIELLPIGRFSVMLLVITDDGRTRNRILRISKDFSTQAKECFDNVIQNRILRKTADTLTKGYMQTVIAETGLYALELMPIFTAIFETAAEIGEKSVHLSGENALYNICGNEQDARKIASLIKSRDPFISILEQIENGAGAVFGKDTGYPELWQDTIIAARFSGADKYKGYVGVIGPTRMSYEQIMPGIEYTAEKLTKIMTEAQKDMED